MARAGASRGACLTHVSTRDELGAQKTRVKTPTAPLRGRSGALGGTNVRSEDQLAAASLRATCLAAMLCMVMAVTRSTQWVLNAR